MTLPYVATRLAARGFSIPNTSQTTRRTWSIRLNGTGGPAWTANGICVPNMRSRTETHTVLHTIRRNKEWMASVDMCDRLSMLNPHAMREIELERRLNASLTDLRRPPKWNGHYVDWHEWTESQLGALHCFADGASVDGERYCDGVGPKHMWQPWWCNGFVEGTDLFLHLERCPVCGLTQVWENWPDRPFDECWTLDDETVYEPEGIFIEPEEPIGKDDE